LRKKPEIEMIGVGRRDY